MRSTTSSPPSILVNSIEIFSLRVESNAITVIEKWKLWYWWIELNSILYLLGRVQTNLENRRFFRLQLCHEWAKLFRIYSQLLLFLSMRSIEAQKTIMCSLLYSIYILPWVVDKHFQTISNDFTKSFCILVDGNSHSDRI